MGNRVLILRILIDTGDSNVPEYIDYLARVLSSERVQLEKIIITHWHHDHMGGVKDIFEKFAPGCEVLKHPRLQGETEDLPDGFPSPLTNLQDGQKIFTEGATLRVIQTPGHTTDHVVLHLEEEEAVFCGDCILGEGTTVFEDLHDYLLSLRKILEVNAKILYPGHGNIIESPAERIQYYLAHRQHREEQILQVLASFNWQLVTAMDIVRQAYKETPEHLYPAAEVNVNHHLEKLLKEKRVVHSEGRWKLANQSSL
ncbi:endoribonuclease LACTB2-like isoform X2 [Artemia franciscana]|uniref:endoribonuclease LACTB2-like isoform X2 n=1 Tax=Artemia franciscana TaxID=6661 RepID=UPI0032DB54C5